MHHTHATRLMTIIAVAGIAAVVAWTGHLGLSIIMYLALVAVDYLVLAPHENRAYLAKHIEAKGLDAKVGHGYRLHFWNRTK